MSSSAVLRLTIDGDPFRTFQSRERITGKLNLILEEEARVRDIKVSFIGECFTQTSRLHGVTGKDDTRRMYEEHVRFFAFDHTIDTEPMLKTGKYSWPFAFTFPDQTQPRFSRLAHGKKYRHAPHQLPPSLRLRTQPPDGKAIVSYHIHAKFVPEMRETQRASHSLKYQPPHVPVPLHTGITSRTLYGQILEPSSKPHKSRTSFRHKFSCKHYEDLSRVVPTLHFPRSVGPSQQLAIFLSLSGRKLGEYQGILDSLEVTISTYTTTMCGRYFAHLEDSAVKHICCISKHNINQALTHPRPTALTTDFRLTDNAECIPSFTSYTISRHYTLTIKAGLIFGPDIFTIHSTTPLEILPRDPSADPPSDDDEEEPLPVYEPRKVSSELAPDYETLYSAAEISAASTRLELALVDSGVSCPTLKGLEVTDSPYEDVRAEKKDLQVVVRPVEED